MRGDNESKSEADRLRELRKQKRKELRALGLSDDDIREHFSDELGDDDDGGGGAVVAGNSGASAGGTNVSGSISAGAGPGAGAGAGTAASGATTGAPGAATQSPPRQPYMGSRSIAACNLANVRLAFKQEPALMNRFRSQLQAAPAHRY
jgi:hypothetical protein